MVGSARGLLIAVGIGLAGCGESPMETAPSDPGTWSSDAPACTEVKGAAVTFTRDGGATIARFPSPGCGGITAIVALQAKDTLLATQTCPSAILRSTDRGCTWQVIDTMYDSPLHPGATSLAASAGDRGYVWALADGGTGTLLRIDGDQITLRRKFDAFVTTVAADAADPERVALADGRFILHSTDGGKTFTRAPGPHHTGTGGATAAPGRTDTFAISSYKYLYTTHDGGASWLTTADDMGGPLAIDASGEVLWYLDPTVATERSSNGGRSFSRVGPAIDASAVAVDPSDAESLWWIGGTALGDLRAGDGEPKIHEAPLQMAVQGNLPAMFGFASLAFSPADPRLVYLAVASFGE